MDVNPIINEAQKLDICPSPSSPALDKESPSAALTTAVQTLARTARETTATILPAKKKPKTTITKEKKPKTKKEPKAKKEPKVKKPPAAKRARKKEKDNDPKPPIIKKEKKKKKHKGLPIGWAPPPFDLVSNDVWRYDAIPSSKQRTNNTLLSHPFTVQLPTEIDLLPQEQQVATLLASTTQAVALDPQSDATNPKKRAPKRKRKVSTLVAPTPVVSIERTAHIILPGFLSRALWLRHGYTHTDIINTLQCFRPLHLWHLALSERLALTKLAVQPSYEAPDRFVYGAKAIVIDHLKQWIQETYLPPDPEKHVLIKTDNSHVPPLPVHTIEGPEYETWLRQLPSKREHGLSVIRYSELSEPALWRGIYCVPLEIEEDRYLLMTRAIRKDEYDRTFGTPDCLTMTPTMIEMMDKTQWCLLDESWYFLRK